MLAPICNRGQKEKANRKERKAYAKYAKCKIMMLKCFAIFSYPGYSGLQTLLLKSKIGIRQILLDLLINIIQMKNLFYEKTSVPLSGLTKTGHAGHTKYNFKL